MIKQLNINNYETSFILGNDDFEKCSQCHAIININIRFVDGMPACDSDNLDDTVCYSHLTGFLEEKLKNRQFNLIEYAAQCIYDLTLEYLKETMSDKKIMLRVELIKSGALARKLGSTSFICSDW